MHDRSDKDAVGRDDFHTTPTGAHDRFVRTDLLVKAARQRKRSCHKGEECEDADDDDHHELGGLP